MADVSVVVVTYNALPYLEQCLASVRDYRTIVVDHGSTDGTLELVRTRFPDAELVEQENRGLAAGWNTGLARASERYALLLNADAWVVGDGVERLAAFADAHPDAALVGPRLRNLDGSLQRSVRGVPTRWRLASEYRFLRKVAPRSRLLNSFYGARCGHEDVLDAGVLMGGCLLVRREAAEAVGPLDESFFMFNEETDWCYRFRASGWRVLFFPGAEVVHVGGASHGGRLFRENVRSQLRFLAKHRGAREAERLRRLLLAALRLRGALFPGERGRMYRDVAAWLASGPTGTLLDSPR